MHISICIVIATLRISHASTIDASLSPVEFLEIKNFSGYIYVHGP